MMNAGGSRLLLRLTDVLLFALNLSGLETATPKKIEDFIGPNYSATVIK